MDDDLEQLSHVLSLRRRGSLFVAARLQAHAKTEC